ncbi:MAG: hemolysin III family protein [Rhodobacterales bacterium]|nr:hemolysin III family protein [Rhodobacterales bacterium]
MLLDVRHSYSRAEWISDAVVHVLGVVAALMAVPVLITLAIVLRGDAPAIAATALYGVALIAMLVFSALYNMTTSPGPRRIFRSLDHSAILMKIAATYTPLALLSGAEATGLLAGLWTSALVGAAMRALAPDRLKLAAVALALLMGWAGLLAGGQVFANLSAPVMALIVCGGLLYTLGVGFFLFDRLPYHYTIWHVCVLAASAVFYAAVTVQLVQSA